MSHKSRLTKLERRHSKRPILTVVYGEGTQRGEMGEAEQQAVIEQNPAHEVMFIHVVCASKAQEVSA